MFLLFGCEVMPFDFPLEGGNAFPQIELPDQLEHFVLKLDLGLRGGLSRDNNLGCKLVNQFFEVVLAEKGNDVG